MDFNAVNRALNQATEGQFLSPYYALEQVRDVLAERNCHLPELVFCDSPTGEGLHLFQLSEDRWLAFKYKRDEDHGVFEAFATVMQKPDDEEDEEDQQQQQQAGPPQAQLAQQTQTPVKTKHQAPDEPQPLRNPVRNNRKLTVGPPDEKIGTDFAKS
jgi:hypothetical protein